MEGGKTRLRLFDGVVHLYREDGGGGLLGTRVLGELDEALYAVTPPEHWAQVDEWLDEKRDAERHGRDYHAEVMRWN